MKRLLLETSFSKIYMIVMILITLLIIGGYFSYAMFTVTKEKNNAISIVTGSLDYHLTVDGEETNSLSVSANSSKEFVVELSNPNDRIARFNFYYIGSLSSGVYAGYVDEAGYNSPPSEVGVNLEKSGSNGPSNIYKIMVTNNTSSDVEITLGVSVGLDYNDLTLPSNGHVFSMYKIDYLTKILVDNDLQEEKAHMFNYTSNGMQVNVSDALTEYVTTGLYKSIDEDGDSYYYRGAVENNNVQFGEYTEDYYLYNYSWGYFQTLKSCQEYNSNCSEDNRVKLASAGDKMYWKIIRVNGDGSLRLLYNGTSSSLTYNDISSSYLIGRSLYNKDATNPKYTGYTYDRDSNEIDSVIKEQLDLWYSNTLGNNIIYDSKVILGRYCNDTSGYKVATEYGYQSRWYFYSSFARLLQYLLNFANDNEPTFICPDTTENYGGSYNLKVGLITADELIFAGESHAVKGNSYLTPPDSIYNSNYDYYGYATMTASTLNADGADIFEDRPIYLYSSNLDSILGIRPVINISSDYNFIKGDGTLQNPYLIG